MSFDNIHLCQKKWTWNRIPNFKSGGSVLPEWQSGFEKENWNYSLSKRGGSGFRNGGSACSGMGGQNDPESTLYNAKSPVLL